MFSKNVSRNFFRTFISGEGGSVDVFETFFETLMTKINPFLYDRARFESV